MFFLYRDSSRKDGGDIQKVEARARAALDLYEFRGRAELVRADKNRIIEITFDTAGRKSLDTISSLASYVT